MFACAHSKQKMYSLLGPVCIWTWENMKTFCWCLGSFLTQGENQGTVPGCTWVPKLFHHFFHPIFWDRLAHDNLGKVEQFILHLVLLHWQISTNLITKQVFVQEPQLRGSYWNVLVAKCLPCLSFAGTFLGIRLLSFLTALGPASLPLQRLSLSQHRPVFSSWQTNSSSDPHALFRLPLSLVDSTGRSRWAPSPPWPEQVSVQKSFWPDGSDSGAVQCLRRKWAVRYPHIIVLCSPHLSGSPTAKGRCRCTRWLRFSPHAKPPLCFLLLKCKARQTGKSMLSGLNSFCKQQGFQLPKQFAYSYVN